MITFARPEIYFVIATLIIAATILAIISRVRQSRLACGPPQQPVIWVLLLAVGQKRRRLVWVRCKWCDGKGWWGPIWNLSECLHCNSTGGWWEE